MTVEASNISKKGILGTYEERISQNGENLSLISTSSVDSRIESLSNDRSLRSDNQAVTIYNPRKNLSNREMILNVSFYNIVAKIY